MMARKEPIIGGEHDGTISTFPILRLGDDDHLPAPGDPGLAGERHASGPSRGAVIDHEVNRMDGGRLALAGEPSHGPVERPGKVDLESVDVLVHPLAGSERLLGRDPDRSRQREIRRALVGRGKPGDMGDEPYLGPSASLFNVSPDTVSTPSWVVTSRVTPPELPGRESVIVPLGPLPACPCSRGESG